jgi:hypothetical protein
MRPARDAFDVRARRELRCSRSVPTRTSRVRDFKVAVRLSLAQVGCLRLAESEGSPEVSQRERGKIIIESKQFVGSESAVRARLIVVVEVKVARAQHQSRELGSAGWSDVECASFHSTAALRSVPIRSRARSTPLCGNTSLGIA